jgi:hypothetical protein
VSTNEQQSRRALLRAAAGAFSLAVSGLFLPVSLEDVDAKGGVLGGKRGGRRRKHRREKRNAAHRKRQKARKNDKPRKGALGLLNVAVYVHNLRATDVAAREWQMIGIDEVIRWGPKTDWQTIEKKPASGPEHFIDYVADVRGLAIALNTKQTIEVGNPPIGFPWIAVRGGEWNSLGWDGNGPTLINTGLAEWESASAPGFTVQRLGDSATHKRFLVNLV